jgi:hypothetical protein
MGTGNGKTALFGLAQVLLAPADTGIARELATRAVGGQRGPGGAYAAP